jgi:uncharacterized membrane protein (DUF106 family)
METFILVLQWIGIITCLFSFFLNTVILDENIKRKKTIERMRVWQKNQEDREKQLLERIKFLENNQK